MIPVVVLVDDPGRGGHGADDRVSAACPGWLLSHVGWSGPGRSGGR